MTKTLNQILFPLHQNQNIFSATLGMQVKWSVPYEWYWCWKNISIKI
jgi:hypothetical protein